MNKIVLKLGGTIMVLFLVVLLPLGYVANQIFTSFYYNQVGTEIDDLSKKYARTITSFDDEQILNMFKTLADLTNKDIYIVDSNGSVIAKTGIRVGDISEEEMKQLSQGQPVRKKFMDVETESSYLGSGYPITQQDSFIGAFFVLASTNDVIKPVEKVRDLLILSAVGALFLALGLTFILSKKMSDPLLEMEQATRQIAKGNLDIRVNIPSRDELGSLGKAINDLAFETNRYRTNRKEFFANISHELRTPISYMKGYAQVLKQGLYKTEAERVQYLSIIEDETERMVRLIDDLFDLSKMEEGKIDLHMAPTDLTEVLEAALLTIKIDMQTKGLDLNTYIQKEIPYIEADGLRLQQVLMNLLGNAVRYTESGTIDVRVWYEKGQVHVEIKDTGIGIPEKELPFIFERFHRVDKSRSRELGGTGLGLAIVKNLVELQNGTITVTSNVNKGTTFYLHFPVSEEDL
ncbi:sensor histidine kinase [Terrihalobacillus insolitus]|uniref:sensor histidine kinase n=1 Tax=Terrihalobacillus insolitus TaxID=2950438 RepID=UPI00234007CE|nr:HAMP domain-containing sensor histidine kinase [Terrihalobacillus insolitus]MDC3414799.1 HAMP domain-containing histidine kinase [Terrihalobacillus insolitus]